MASRQRLALAALCAALLCSSLAVARAQQLQRLHVRSFVLATDTVTPGLGQPFHLRLKVVLGDRVTHVDNVILPALGGLDILGDEHRTQTRGGVTTYQETLTLVPLRAGELTISPAYLDAIDASDRKPKRFISNELTVHVRGAPFGRSVSTLRSAAIATVEILFLLAALFVVVAIFARRRRIAAPPLPRAVPPPEPLAPRDDDPRERLSAALETLRARRDRRSAEEVRRAVWRLLGADGRETMNDVLPRCTTTERRSAVVALERAAFVDDPQLESAIDEALTRAEVFVRS
jgi:hypothetical protein